ncbi:hypothetical protein IQ07DRAFT_633731 [Pyrenochaeta sp. DS3sAY3a]|nr:hypothetical protein IQ07DRAFT_633731 [Pyrenochaeta sp. DS3sAY3a]
MAAMGGGGRVARSGANCGLRAVLQFEGAVGSTLQRRNCSWEECWGPSELSALCHFHSGCQVPHFTIPSCSTQPPTCSLSPASGDQEQDAYGPPSINWDYAFSFTAADSNDSLLQPTSLPLSSSTSLDSLPGVHLAHDSSFDNDLNWNTFSLPSSDSHHFLGNDNSLASGNLTSFTTAGEQLNILAMSSGLDMMSNTDLSEPMIKDLSQSGSSSTSSKGRISSSPEQSSAYSRMSTTKHSPLAPESTKIEKRKANTLAARRYRQKRVDQMSGLESELKEVKTERDDLKVRCARLEGEVETLRALLRAQK